MVIPRSAARALNRSLVALSILMLVSAIPAVCPMACQREYHFANVALTCLFRAALPSRSVPRGRPPAPPERRVLAVGACSATRRGSGHLRVAGRGGAGHRVTAA